MNFKGRQWLSRIKYALSAAYALEEDPFWKSEFLRALILVHELWETGRVISDARPVKNTSHGARATGHESRGGKQ